MSGELDEYGLEAAARAVYEALPNFGMERRPNTAGGYDQVRVDDPWDQATDRHDDCKRQAEAAIRAYLAASPSRSEMGVVAWSAIGVGQMAVDPKGRWIAVRDFDQAQSALAAMRAHQQRCATGWAEALNEAEAAEAQVQRLTEENEALRTDAGELVVSQYALSAAQTKIRNLEALIDAQHGDVVARTAKLLYEKDDKIIAAQARIKALEEAVNEAFDFLGGIDGAAEIRGHLLAALKENAL